MSWFEGGMPWRPPVNGGDDGMVQTQAMVSDSTTTAPGGGTGWQQFLNYSGPVGGGANHFDLIPETATPEQRARLMAMMTGVDPDTGLQRDYSGQFGRWTSDELRNQNIQNFLSGGDLQNADAGHGGWLSHHGGDLLSAVTNPLDFATGNRLSGEMGRLGNRIYDNTWGNLLGDNAFSNYNRHLINMAAGAGMPGGEAITNGYRTDYAAQRQLGETPGRTAGILGTNFGISLAAMAAGEAAFGGGGGAGAGAGGAGAGAGAGAAEGGGAAGLVGGDIAAAGEAGLGSGLGAGNAGALAGTSIGGGGAAAAGGGAAATAGAGGFFGNSGSYLPIIQGLIGAAGSYLGSREQSAAAQHGIDAQLAMFGITRAGLDPYMAAGYGALNPLMNLASGDPRQVQRQMEALPGYQFARTQGLKSVQNTAAARGLGSSGAALKGAANFATGLANQTYGDQFSRLYNLAGLGENAAAGVGNAAIQTGQGLANSYGNLGAANAAGYLGAGNALGSSLNQYYLQWLLQQQQTQQQGLYG